MLLFNKFVNVLSHKGTVGAKMLKFIRDYTIIALKSFFYSFLMLVFTHLISLIVFTAGGWDVSLFLNWDFIKIAYLYFLIPLNILFSLFFSLVVYFSDKELKESLLRRFIL